MAPPEKVDLKDCARRHEELSKDLNSKLDVIQRDVGKISTSCATISTRLDSMPGPQDITDAVQQHCKDRHRRDSVNPSRLNGRAKTGVQIGGAAGAGMALYYLFEALVTKLL